MKNIISILYILLFAGTAFAQNQPVEVKLSQQEQELLSKQVKDYKVFNFDYSQLLNELRTAKKASFTLKVDELHSWTIYLEEADVRTEEYKSSITTPNYCITFKGTTNDNKKVRFTITENYFSGLIFDNENLVYLKPIEQFKINTTDNTMVLYTQDKTINEAFLNTNIPNVGEKRSENRDIKVVLIGDASYNSPLTAGEMPTILNEINGLYNQVGITLKLADFKLFTPNTDPFIEQRGESPVLQEFKRYCENNLSSVDADIFHLFTKRLTDNVPIEAKPQEGDLYKNGTGWALDKDKYSLTSITSFEYFIITAHEIAHNLGASDSPDDGNCSASTGRSTMCKGGAGRTLWFSETTKQEINTYINLVPKISVTDTENMGGVFGEITDNGLYGCAIGVPRIATFTIKNEGGLLQLTGSPKIKVSGTGYTLLNSNVPATITKDSPFTFQVAFTPTSVDDFYGTITIANNDPTQNPFTLYLWGYGRADFISKNQIFATHTPATNELNVAVNTPIVVTFDTPISGLTASNISVSGSFSGIRTETPVISGNTITFTPNLPYQAGEVITVTLTKYVNNFKLENTFQFTVKANAPTTPSPLFHFSSNTYTDAYRETPNLTSQDCNGDGKLDLVFGRYVLLNSGNANFVYTPNAIAPTNPYDPTLGDFNNDGLFDKITTNGQIITVSTNNGNTTFSLKASIDLELPIQSVRIADLNHDGFLDIVVGSEWYSYTDISTAKVSILLNNRMGGFYTPTDYYFNESDSYYPTIGDFDGDNDLDIAVSGYGSDVYILTNNGSGSFSSILVYNHTNGWVQNVHGTLACGDFDNDGDLDLAAADLDFENVVVLLKSKQIANKNVSSPQKSSVRIYSYQKTACVVNSTNGRAKVTIYDLLGRVVSEQQVNTGLQKIELQKSGAYIVKVVSEIGTTTQKIVIRE